MIGVVRADRVELVRAIREARAFSLDQPYRSTARTVVDPAGELSIVK